MTGSRSAATHYDERYFAWQNTDIEIKNRLKVKLFAPHVGADDVVLDFGCAGGGLLGGLRCARKIGVEINDTARAAAEAEHGIEAYESLSDVPDGIANVIISNHTLEHLATPYEALCRLRSKLAPGGRLVLVLPIDDWRAQQRWDPHDINRHLYTWTPLNLGNLLDEAGYEVTELRIIRRTLMRGFARFARLPEPLFEAVRAVYSRLRHRQEVLAVARPARRGDAAGGRGGG